MTASLRVNRLFSHEPGQPQTWRWSLNDLNISLFTQFSPKFIILSQTRNPSFKIQEQGSRIPSRTLKDLCSKVCKVFIQGSLSSLKSKNLILNYKFWYSCCGLIMITLMCCIIHKLESLVCFHDIVLACGLNFMKLGWLMWPWYKSINVHA